MLDQRPGDTFAWAGEMPASTLERWRTLATKRSGSVPVTRQMVRRAELSSRRCFSFSVWSASILAMASASVSTSAEVGAPGVGGGEVLVIMGLLYPLVDFGGNSLKRQD